MTNYNQQHTSDGPKSSAPHHNNPGSLVTRNDVNDANQAVTNDITFDLFQWNKVKGDVIGNCLVGIIDITPGDQTTRTTKKSSYACC